ncbi:MAG: pyridoxal phosphate-dependent aminotransferase family protein, partial [Spirochaetaceae bacterium]|nr:pyridoxal phosphate-dependent aminotransferase family protein [Spirochaetaceae bacterium]
TDVKLQNWLNSVNPFINDNIHSQPPDAGHKWQALKDALAAKKQERCYRETRLMESGAGASARYKGREFIMLASNNYLNLAGDPRLSEAAARSAAIYGWGAGGSRLTTGTMPPHQELEEALAEWKGTESALLFNTGYMANVGVISALCSTKGGGGTDGGGTCREWTIFSDANNHASIIDGCRLSGARIAVYRHNDMDDLEAKAAAVYAANGNAKGLIVSDSVFSMDGDIVDLPRFVDIAARYGFLSMIDEAHGSGCIGKTGRGVTELFGVKPDIITGTCSKALGSEGGFVCGSSLLIDFLVNHARSFIFATAPPPPVAAATLAALRIIQTEPELTRRLQSNIRFFCELLRLRGIPANSSTAIIPIIIGDEEKALAASDFLLEEGFFVPAIRYPTVPKGEAMLRAVVCRAHTEEQLDNAAAAIAKIYTPYKPNRKTGTMNSGG